jgi:hypothetical protein
MKQLTVPFRAVAMTVLLIGMNSNPALADLMLIDLPTKVVTCDLIARVKVLSLQGDLGLTAVCGVARCEVLESAKGLEKGANFDLDYSDMSSPGVSYKAGEDCIVFATIQPSGRYSTFNTRDGKYAVEGHSVLRWREADNKWNERKVVEVLAIIRGLVDVPGDWSKPVKGISVLLRPTQIDYTIGQNIGAVILFKNTSNEPVSITLRGFPIETRTYWSLAIRHGEDQIVNPTPHPHMTQQNIKDYAKKHIRAYSIKLAPGGIGSQRLPRINNAQKGWGVKNELNYSYYAMDKPGTYSISAEGHNILPGELLKTNPFKIVIHQKDSG